MRRLYLKYELAKLIFAICNSNVNFSLYGCAEIKAQAKTKIFRKF